MIYTHHGTPIHVNWRTFSNSSKDFETPPDSILHSTFSLGGSQGSQLVEQVITPSFGAGRDQTNHLALRAVLAMSWSLKTRLAPWLAAVIVTGFVVADLPSL